MPRSSFTIIKSRSYFVQNPAPNNYLHTSPEHHVILESFKIYFYYTAFAWIYLYAPHACLVPPEARRGYQIPLELELQITVNCHVGMGTKPRSSARTARVLNHWAISSVFWFLSVWFAFYLKFHFGFLLRHIKAIGMRSLHPVLHLKF